MEGERERLLQDLEQYRAILDLTTDKEATAAIEQLIRETRVTSVKLVEIRDWS